MKLLVLALYVTTSLFGLYKLKTAAIGINADFVIGFLAYAAGFLIWLALLRLYPLSLAFPMAAGALIVGTQLVGVLSLDEPFGWSKALGVGLLLAGLAVLTVLEVGEQHG